MTPSSRTPPGRPAPASRRTGYVVALFLNAGILYAANRWPGWDTLGFLTEDTTRVLPMVSAAVVAGIVANVAYLVHDPRWVRAVGDLVTTAFGVAALVRVWEVFPFAFAGGFDWALLVRVLLVVAIAGSVIGMLVQVATLFRLMGSRTSHRLAGR